VVRVFEQLGAFREPLAGLEPQLAHVEEALENLADDPQSSLAPEAFEALVSGAHAARTRIREAGVSAAASRPLLRRYGGRHSCARTAAISTR
jgi:hypothetical protein